MRDGYEQYGACIFFDAELRPLSVWVEAEKRMVSIRGSTRDEWEYIRRAAAHNDIVPLLLPLRRLGASAQSQQRARAVSRRLDAQRRSPRERGHRSERREEHGRLEGSCSTAGSRLSILL